MRGSAAFRAAVAPGGVLAGPWVRNELWRRARAVPSLDLRFADDKSLRDAASGQQLVTFTRASSGTFVGSDGLIRTAVTNLLLRSEEFDNASWSKDAGVTITADTSQGQPYTGAKVYKVDYSGANLAGPVQTLTFSAISYTGSWWIKGTAGETIRFAGQSGTGASNFTLTGQWQRITLTWTGAAATTGFALNTGASVTARTVYVSGAQLEQSSTVGEYIPTTSTINSAPRFDHNPVTGESLGLLVEEQRTNSIRNNTMVGAVAGTPGTLPTNWVTNLPANGISGAVSAIGTENGITYIDYRISGTASADIAPVLRFEANNNAAASSGQSWTASLYAKLVAGSLGSATLNHQLRWADSGGTVLSTVSTGAAFTPTGSALVTQRYSATGTAIASTAFVSQLVATSTIANGSTVDFTLRIGLPQLEQGAFATSVIPTTTATVTRSADVPTNSGTSFSSWFNSSAMTIYSEAASASGAAYSGYIYSIGSDFNNSIQHYRQSDFQPVARVRTASTDEYGAIGNGAVWTGTSTNKFALALSTASGRQASNGLLTSGSDDTSISFPSMSSMTIGFSVGGSSYFNGHIRRLTFWPQRLPNSTLQEVTR